MIIVGLTGSIGMGKSTTAKAFRDAGAPVFDADAAVHELYAQGGAAVEAVAAEFPDVVVDGAVDRGRLRARLQGDSQAFARLEAIVHPLVGAARRRFLRAARRKDADIVVFDIPLLFETGGEGLVDFIVVVSAPASVQKARVLSRPGMTERAFAEILARQVPDSQKRARADAVIDTSQSIAHARNQVRRLVARLKRRAGRRRDAHA